MPEYTVKTLNYEYLNLNNSLNLSNSFLGSRNILNANMSDNDGSHRISLKYFGLGIGGEVNNILHIPDKKNLTIYGLIPIRITDKNDTFNSNETRDDYRLRHAIVDETNVLGYAYYLKLIRNKNNGNTLFTETIKSDTDTSFQYTESEVRYYLTGEIESPVRFKSSSPGSGFGILPYTDPDSNFDIVERSILRLNINKNDISSIIKFHQDETYGFISEIGLYTGYDIIDPLTGYKEIKDVQLAFHNTFNQLDLREIGNKDLNIDLELR